MPLENFVVPLGMQGAQVLNQVEDWKIKCSWKFQIFSQNETIFTFNQPRDFELHLSANNLISDHDEIKPAQSDLLSKLQLTSHFLFLSPSLRWENVSSIN